MNYFNITKDSLSSIKNVGKIVILENGEQDPLYTFCVPTFKRSLELRKCLESVFDQQTDISYNVIVSDNNPERNDETEKMIRTHFLSHKNLTYVKNLENLGMAGNWNRLILECKTKYMILFHDDDVLLPFFLKEIDKFVTNYPFVSALNTGKYRWNGIENYEPHYRNCPKSFRHNKYTNYAYFTFGAPSGCLFNVEDLKEEGGFDADTYPSHDYVMVQRLCMKGKMVIQIVDKLMLYRIVENATSKIETQTRWLDIDYNIKEELAQLLRIPSPIKKIVEYYEIKLRLRSINKLEHGYEYNGYSAGGKIFLIFFNLYRRIWRTCTLRKVI